MAKLTKEYLTELRRDALEERQKHLDMLQQANGAIAMVDFLLQQLSEPEDKDEAEESQI